MDLYFDQKMNGLSFDPYYLWDNVDEKGNELIYCSEMVQKTLNSALSTPLPTTKMDFTPNWDYWYRYYNGNVPQGAAGNSPGYLATVDDLITLFEGS
jgi:hypothetical protein